MGSSAPSAGSGDPVRNDAPLRWWGSRISERLVDVTALDAQGMRQLSVSPCCSGAGRLLLQCGLCCLLTVVAPVAFLASQGAVAPDIGSWLLAAAGALFLVGLCQCFCSVRRTCCEGVFNLPDPAPSTPPLSRQTHGRKIDVRRVLLVYNPNAGTRRAERMCKDVVVPGLRNRGVRCEVVATERCGHAREIAASIDLNGFDALVSLGGDGTFHELVNGMLAREDAARIPVGIIPLGSGNGLAATLRQSMRRHGTEVPVWSELDDVMQWSADRVAGGRVAMVDLLEVEFGGQRLAGVMQVYLGLTAEVDILSEPYRWLGPARLDLVAAWTILKKKGKEFGCVIKGLDGTIEDLRLNAIGLSIGLNQHYTDKMRAVPHARLDDGLGEVCCFSSEVSRDRLFAGFLKLAHGAHTGDAKAWSTRQFAELALDLGQPGVFNVDGEILRHDGSLRIRVLPQALEMLVGEDEWHWASPAGGGVVESPWKAYPRRWGMLGIFFVSSMLVQAIWISFAPIQGEMMRRYGVSEWMVNFLSLSYMIVYLPCTFPAAYVMDSCGCRLALVIGSSLTLAGASLRCALRPGEGLPFATLLAGQCLCACAQPFFTGMPPKIAAVWFPAHQRAIADTVASLSLTVGAAVGFVLPVALGLEVMLYVQLAWAIVTWLMICLLFRRAPPTPASASSDHRSANFLQELRDALGNKRLLCLLAAFSCALGSFNCFSTLIGALTAPYGFTKAAASDAGVLVVACGIVGAAVATTAVGYSQRYRPVLIFCLSSSSVACALMVVGVAFLGPSWSALFFGSAAAFGFGAMPVMPVAFEAAAEAAYPTGEGTVAGLCMCGGNILGLTQTLILTWLVQRSRATLAWALTLTLFIVGLTAAVLFEPERRRADYEAHTDSRAVSYAGSLVEEPDPEVAVPGSPPSPNTLAAGQRGGGEPLLRDPNTA